MHARRLEEYGPQALANCLWAMARLRMHVSGRLLSLALAALVNPTAPQLGTAASASLHQGIPHGVKKGQVWQKEQDGPQQQQSPQQQHREWQLQSWGAGAVRQGAAAAQGPGHADAGDAEEADEHEEVPAARAEAPTAHTAGPSQAKQPTEGPRATENQAEVTWPSTSLRHQHLANSLYALPWLCPRGTRIVLGRACRKLLLRVDSLSVACLKQRTRSSNSFSSSGDSSRAGSEGPSSFAHARGAAGYAQPLPGTARASSGAPSSGSGRLGPGQEAPGGAAARALCPPAELLQMAQAFAALRYRPSRSWLLLHQWEAARQWGSMSPPERKRLARLYKGLSRGRPAGTHLGLSADCGDAPCCVLPAGPADAQSSIVPFRLKVAPALRLKLAAVG